MGRHKEFRGCLSGLNHMSKCTNLEREYRRQPVNKSLPRCLEIYDSVPSVKLG